MMLIAVKMSAGQRLYSFEKSAAIFGEAKVSGSSAVVFPAKFDRSVCANSR